VEERRRITCTFDDCTHCGQAHEAVEVRETAERPGYTHVMSCPATGRPIYLKRAEARGKA
jgi:hypothetical protein